MTTRIVALFFISSGFLYGSDHKILSGIDVSCAPTHRAHSFLMHAFIHAHTARRDSCTFAYGAGFAIITLAGVAGVFSLTLAERTPVGIIDLHFHFLGPEFVLITGMIAVDRTIALFIARTVTLVAMFETCSATTAAGNLFLGLVQDAVPFAVALSTVCPAFASAHMAGSFA